MKLHTLHQVKHVVVFHLKSTGTARFRSQSKNNMEQNCFLFLVCYCNHTLKGKEASGI